jgi:hypothetical protein
MSEPTIDPMDGFEPTEPPAAPYEAEGDQDEDA